MEYHVMKKTVDNTSCNIAVHLPTPSGANAGGMDWEAIMIMAKPGRSAVALHDRKYREEAADLVKGRIVEVVDAVTFSDPGLSNAQRRAEIRSHVAQMQADFEDTESDLYKQEIGVYEWYGFSEDVPG